MCQVYKGLSSILLNIANVTRDEEASRIDRGREVALHFVHVAADDSASAPVTPLQFLVSKSLFVCRCYSLSSPSHHCLHFMVVGGYFVHLSTYCNGRAHQTLLTPPMCNHLVTWHLKAQFKFSMFVSHLPAFTAGGRLANALTFHRRYATYVYLSSLHFYSPSSFTPLLLFTLYPLLCTLSNSNILIASCRLQCPTHSPYHPFTRAPAVYCRGRYSA